jgi:hypothetical protein
LLLEDNKFKCRAAIVAAMSLCVLLLLLLLLLLPASLGYGGTITIQEAFGQFALPQLEEPTPPEEDTTTPLLPLPLLQQQLLLLLLLTTLITYGTHRYFCYVD